MSVSVHLECHSRAKAIVTYELHSYYVWLIVPYPYSCDRRCKQGFRSRRCSARHRPKHMLCSISHSQTDCAKITICWVFVTLRFFDIERCTTCVYIMADETSRVSTIICILQALVAWWTWARIIYCTIWDILSCGLCDNSTVSTSMYGPQRKLACSENNKFWIHRVPGQGQFYLQKKFPQHSNWSSRKHHDRLRTLCSL